MVCSVSNLMNGRVYEGGGGAAMVGAACVVGWLNVAMEMIFQLKMLMWNVF